MFHASVTTNVNHWRRRLTIMVIRIMSNSLSSPLPSDALLFSLRRRRLVLPLGTTSTQPFLVSSFHPSLFSPPPFPLLSSRPFLFALPVQTQLDAGRLSIDIHLPCLGPIPS